MADSEDEEAALFVEISLPAEDKERLRIACRSKGICMRKYVENLVRTALGIDLSPREPGRNGSNGEGNPDA